MTETIFLKHLFDVCVGFLVQFISIFKWHYLNQIEKFVQRQTAFVQKCL